MLVKCVSSKLNVVRKVGDEVRRVAVGDVFEVTGVPENWVGLVVEANQANEETVVTDPDMTDEKVAVTNPDTTDEELEALRADYKEKVGHAAHHSWDADKVREKLAELP